MTPLSAVLLTFFANIVTSGALAYVAVRYIKKTMRAQSQYIYEAMRQINPDTPPPQVITNRVEGPAKKGSVWCPKKDQDYIMSGKRVDLFD